MNFRTPTRKILIIVWISILTFESIAQTENNREIIEMNLKDPFNKAFFRENIELPTLLLNAAKKGEIDLLYFDDFKNAPKKLTYKKLQKSIEIPLNEEFFSWEDDFSYFYDEIVECKGKLYLSTFEDNLAYPPDTSPEYWEVLTIDYYPTHDISMVQLDQKFINDKYQLQYLHFYLLVEDIEDTLDRYIFSVKANDAIQLLNKSGYLWYSRNEMEPDETEDPGIMGHLIGDVFLMDFDTDVLGSIMFSPIEDLNESLVSLYDKEIGGYANIPVLYSYSKRSIDSVFIYNSPYSSVSFDSIAISQIESFIITNTEFLRLGDALINGQLYSDIQASSYTSFNEPSKMPKAGKPVKLAQVNIVERVNFQIASNRKYQQELALMIADIMDGVRTGQIRLFEQSNKIDDSPTALIDIDDAFIKYYQDGLNDEYVLYEEDWPYYQDDVIYFDSKPYISLKDDNLGNIPSENADYWQVYTFENELYPPQEMLILDIQYKLNFTNKGKIKSKFPEYITLIVTGEFSLDGAMAYLGSISYDELITYKEANNITNWDAIIEGIKDQQSFKFAMKDYGAVREAVK